jgi:diguanylate cyclase (GGDEF)-like protein
MAERDPYAELPDNDTAVADDDPYAGLPDNDAPAPPQRMGGAQRFVTEGVAGVIERGGRMLERGGPLAPLARGIGVGDAAGRTADVLRRDVRRADQAAGRAEEPQNVGDFRGAGLVAQNRADNKASAKPEAPKQPTKKRVGSEGGNFAKDLLASWGSGSNQLLKTVGNLAALTGAAGTDNAAVQTGESGAKRFEDMKSQELIDAEDARRVAVDQETDEFDKGVRFFWESVKNPRLAATLITETVPMTMATGIVGRGVAIGSKVAGASTPAAIRAGTAAGIGAGATLQGADVGGDQLADLAKILNEMPEQRARAIPEIARAIEMGATLEEAKAAYVLQQAQKTAVAAGSVSLAAQALPGARRLERALAGGSRGVRGRFASGLATGAGETLEEMTEEGGGAGLKNVFAQEADPERPLSQGIGEAAAQAAIGGGPIGAVVGAITPPDSDGQSAEGQPPGTPPPAAGGIGQLERIETDDGPAFRTPSGAIVSESQWRDAPPDRQAMWMEPAGEVSADDPRGTIAPQLDEQAAGVAADVQLHRDEAARLEAEAERLRAAGNITQAETLRIQAISHAELADKIEAANGVSEQSPTRPGIKVDEEIQGAPAPLEPTERMQELERLAGVVTDPAVKKDLLLKLKAERQAQEQATRDEATAEAYDRAALETEDQALAAELKKKAAGLRKAEKPTTRGIQVREEPAEETEVGGVDRRKDAATRKKVDEMSAEELRKELKTSPVTGLPNRRAYDEAPKRAVHTSVDVDSLKWVNDNMGHPAGDEMLRAVGEAVKEAGAEGFHLSGDEFVIQSDTTEQAAAAMRKIRAILAKKVISHTQPDGTVYTKRGIGLSHGSGSSVNEAEAKLRQNKSERARRGVRPERGGEPRGVVKETPRAGQATDGAGNGQLGRVPAGDGRGVSEGQVAAEINTTPLWVKRSGLTIDDGPSAAKIRNALAKDQAAVMRAVEQNPDNEAAFMRAVQEIIDEGAQENQGADAGRGRADDVAAAGPAVRRAEAGGRQPDRQETRSARQQAARDVQQDGQPGQPGADLASRSGRQQPRAERDQAAGDLASRSRRDEMSWEDVELGERGDVFVAGEFMLDPVRELEVGTGFGGELMLGHAAHVAPGNRVVRYTITDRAGKALGRTDLQVDPQGNVVALHDISVQNRGQGVGRQVVGSLLANFDTLQILDIVPTARSFWEKLGTGYIDDYGNATLDWSSFARATARQPGRVSPESGRGSAQRPAVQGRPQARQGQGQDLAALWYSPLQRAIEGITTKQASPQQWLNTITALQSKGVKADEIEFSGVKEWLATRDDGKVSRDDLLAFLRDHGVQVSETMLGANIKEMDKARRDYIFNLYEKELLNREARGEISEREMDARLRAFNRALEAADTEEGLIKAMVDEAGYTVNGARKVLAEADDHAMGLAEAPRYSSYVLPGGRNYRELLITLPAKTGLSAETRQKIADLQAQEIALFNRARELSAPRNEAETVSDWQERWTRGQELHEQARLLRIEYVTLENPIPPGWSVYDEALDDQAAGYQIDPSEIGTMWRVAGPGFHSGRQPSREAAMQLLRRQTKEDDGATFQSSHWDEPNIVAHIRFNERADADGKRVLFVEEIQSDWAQQGRKKGFKQLTREQEDELEALTIRDNTPAEAARRAELLQMARNEGVPRAPFVQKTEAWTALALKRVIRYAAENGFDRVAWVNGEQSAARYQLSTQVEAIEYHKNEEGTYGLWAQPHGTPTIPVPAKKTIALGIKEADLENYVGKELALRIAKGDGRHDGYKGRTVLRGLDLKIGGEGMRAFYDKIVPNVAKDVLKKLGGGTVTAVDLEGRKPSDLIIVRGMGDRYVVSDPATGAYVGRLGENRSPHRFVETVEQAAHFPNVETATRALMSSRPVPVQQAGFDITPQMRELAMQGMPLFSRRQPRLGMGEQLASVRAALDDAFGKPLIDGLIRAGILRLEYSWQNKRALARDPSVRALNSEGDERGPGASLFLDRIRAADAPALLMHEVGEHYGLPRMLGQDGYQKIIDGIRRAYMNGDAETVAAWDLVKRDYTNENGTMMVPEGSDNFIREVAAAMVEKGVERGWIREMLDAIRSWLTRTFGVDVDKVDGNLLRGLATSALRQSAAGMLPRTSQFTADRAGSASRSMSLEADRISPRAPTAVKRTEDPLAQELQPDLRTMLRNREVFEHNLRLLTTSPDIRVNRRASREAQAEEVITHFQRNLEWLFDHVSPEIRDRAKLWYVGGNKIAHSFANRFDIEPRQAAGVIAALSPQKDWFQNVSLAERIMSAVYEHPDSAWTPAMDNVLATRDWGKGISQGDRERIRGKTLREVWGNGTAPELLSAAHWIRAWDEATNPQMARVITPEGNFASAWDVGNTGKPIALRAQGFSAMAKSLRILADGSRESISAVIGANHKVRSFYNNIISPYSTSGDVTIDTHAVAAAHLLPLGSSSDLVAQTFGGGNVGQPASKSSDLTGLMGNYAFYAEAYRRAAAAKGVLPREMQSVTWEAVRGLFRPEQKVALKRSVATIWERYGRGEIDESQAREETLRVAEGVAAPKWAGSAAGRTEVPQASSYAAQLPGAVAPGGGAAPDSVGDDGRGAGGTEDLASRSPNTPAFKAWFGDSKVVDEDGEPLMVYHGTTGDFDTFDRSRGNPESDFGAGFYFSNTPEDVANNYAGEGPDLTAKLQIEAERVADEMNAEAGIDSWRYDSPQVMRAARQRLGVQHGGASMPVYLKMENPVVVGNGRDGKDTFLDYDDGWNPETEEYDPEPTASPLQDFIEALRDVAGNYQDGEVDTAIGAILEEASGDGIHASKLIQILKDTEEFNYYTDDEGKLVRSEIWRQAFERAGFDGIIDNTVDVKFGSQKRIGRGMQGMTPDTVHYIAFKPTQIKSAIGNRGTFDENDPNILAAKSRALPQPPTNSSQLDAETNAQTLQRKFFDRFNRVRQLQRERRPGIADDKNVVQADTLYYGRAQYEGEELERKFIEPLGDALKEAKTLGLTVRDADDYLMARHAPERNRVIAMRNPNMPDGGSGLTNRQAAQILAKYDPKKTAALDKIAQIVYRMNEDRLLRQETSGLISPQMATALRTQYKNYVPLKTLDEEGAVMGMGRGYELRNSGIEMAFGRQSKAGSPIASSIMDAARAVVMSEKAKVDRVIWALANDPDVIDVMTPVDDANAAQHFSRQRLNPTTGQIETVSDSNWRSREDVVKLRVDGEEKYVWVRDDILRDQLRKVASLADPGPVLRGLGRVTSTIGRLLTEFNPTFTLPNAVRDAIGGVIKSNGIERVNPLRVAAGIPAAWKSIVDFKRDANTPGGRMYREFQQDGAKTGAYGITDVADTMHRLERLGAELGYPGKERGITTKLMHGLNDVAKFVGHANEVIEYATRLSLYKEARRVGYSRKQAAVWAKELTVNFNRSGEYGRTMNSIFVFANAALQGLYGAIMFGKSNKVKAALLGLVVLGAITQAFNEAYGGDDEETDEKNVNTISDHTLDNNATVLIPGSANGIKIPLPPEFSFLYAMGRRLYRAASQGNYAKEAAGIIGAILGSTLPLRAPDASSTPLSVMKALTPTAVSPFMDLAVNEDFRGAPIVPNQRDKDAPQPWPVLARSSTSDVSKAIASLVNTATGGDTVEPGAAQKALGPFVSPEAMDHVVGFYTGGLGQFALQSKNLARAVGGDESAVEINRIPIANRFVFTQPVGYVGRRYRELAPDFQYAMARQRDGSSEKVKDEVAAALPAYRSAERQLTPLFKQLRAAGEEGDKARIEELRSQIRAVQSTVLKAYNESRPTR